MPVYLGLSKLDISKIAMYVLLGCKIFFFYLGEAISLSPLYHFHPLHRYLDISQVITAESSPLHIASSQTQTGTFVFQVQVANHQATHPNMHPNEVGRLVPDLLHFQNIFL